VCSTCYYPRKRVQRSDFGRCTSNNGHSYGTPSQLQCQSRAVVPGPASLPRLPGCFPSADHARRHTGDGRCLARFNFWVSAWIHSPTSKPRSTLLLAHGLAIHLCPLSQRQNFRPSRLQPPHSTGYIQISTFQTSSQFYLHTFQTPTSVLSPRVVPEKSPIAVRRYPHPRSIRASTTHRRL
jgi:hypothetical protein